MERPQKSKYRFSDIVDIEELRLLFVAFSKFSGFTIGLVEHRSNVVLIRTGWRDICTRFHRSSPKSAVYCRASNQKITNKLYRLGQINLDQCKNGLIDGATPIIIKGQHLGDLFSGQVFFKAPDLERFREQAQEHGYDSAAYLEAVKKSTHCY